MSTPFNNDTGFDLEDTIDDFGHAVISVGTGACSVPGCTCAASPVPWSYTVGLIEQSCPELVTFGLGADDACVLLNQAASRFHCPDCGGCEPGSVVRSEAGFVRFDELPPDWALDREVDPIARWWKHYQHPRSLGPPRLIQVVWSDRDGRFPDDPDCETGVVAVQPVGDRLLGDWSQGADCRPNRAARRARQRRRR